MRILLVDDNSEHRELIRLALTGYDSTWEVEAVASEEEAFRLLLGGDVFDLVFLDYSFPGRDGLEVLEEIRRGETPPPVVMVTGRGDEQVAVKAMKGGAYDYVVKGGSYLQRLPVVAQRAVEAYQLAVERKRAEEALRESEQKYKELFEQMSSGVAVYEAVDNGEDFVLRDLNSAGEAIEHVNREDIVGKRVTEVFPGVKEFGVFEVFQRVWKTGKSEYFPERLYKDQRDTGTWRESWVYKLPGGEIVAIYNNITERKRSEEQIKSQMEELQRWQDVMLGREDRVQELKREVNELCRQLGEKIRYSSQEEP